jgi:hypothetical protein
MPLKVARFVEQLQNYRATKGQIRYFNKFVKKLSLQFIGEKLFDNVPRSN